MQGRVNLTVAPEIGAEKTYTSQFLRKSHRRHRSKVLGIRVFVFGRALHSNAITQCGDWVGVTGSDSKCIVLSTMVRQILPGGKPHKKSQPVVRPSHRPVAHFKFKSGHRAILVEKGIVGTGTLTVPRPETCIAPYRRKMLGWGRRVCNSHMHNSQALSLRINRRLWGGTRNRDVVVRPRISLSSRGRRSVSVTGWRWGFKQKCQIFSNSLGVF